MKAAWLSVPVWLVALGCQTPDRSTTPELARPSEEPVAVSVAVGGVT